VASDRTGCGLSAGRASRPKASAPHALQPGGPPYHALPSPKGLPTPAQGNALGICQKPFPTLKGLPTLPAMPQSLSKVYLHVVFSTKNREPWLRPEIRAEVHRYVRGVAGHHDCPAILVGGVSDHVHLLGLLGRTIAQAEL
jgi:hypothetical protein